MFQALYRINHLVMSCSVLIGTEYIYCLRLYLIFLLIKGTVAPTHGFVAMFCRTNGQVGCAYI